MSSHTVSIAMAAYNGAKYIAEQLDSFARQTRLPDELIITDDGSTDGTLQIVEEFRCVAPFPVKLFANAHRLGFAKNFERAMSLCSGDLIFLSDQDDVWFDGKVSTVGEIMVCEPECWLLVHDGQLVDESLSPSDVTKMGQLRSGYGSSHHIMTGALTVARREFLSMALPIPVDLTGHDVWLHKLSTSFEGRRIVVNDCLQYIRRHASNTSEWIVNSRRRIGSLDVLQAQMKAQPATDYGDRLRLNKALRDRLAELIVAGCPGEVESAVQGAVKRLRREHTALAARQLLINSGPVNRRLRALAMLMRQDYAEFNGMRSFLRDVAR